MPVSVILPTHNPDSSRLARTLGGLRVQTLASAAWELVVVDSGSSDAAALRALDLSWRSEARVVREASPGLTRARLRGFAEARGDPLILVDDDNVLDPDYLERAVALAAAEPSLGAAGGVSLPDFEKPPPPWVREFDGLLALRDLGRESLRANWRGDAPRAYPRAAPIGAGMMLRQTAAAAYARAVTGDARRRGLDRFGADLRSGGDNDLVMTVLEAGYDVGYAPYLALQHLIPVARTTPEYLGRLNRAITRSWVVVLALHGLRPWSPVARSTVPLRSWRAWWRTRAWRGPADWVRWQGQRGQFEGRAELAERGPVSS